jgi:MFS family permease
MRTLYKTALPLASLTAVGMLATDFYLPAVPFLPALLGGTVTQAQATLAVFMAALAISQLLWGWALDRFGERAMILLGMALLGGASLLCALAPDIDILLIGRTIQGLGAGAATVAVPALLRKRSSDAAAIQSIALVGMAESVIPALGPVAGTFVITHGDWRWTFWIVALLTFMLAPLVTRILSPASAIVAPAPSTGSGIGDPVSGSSYLTLLRNPNFMRLAIGYALMFSALLMFVASAPQLITGWLRHAIDGFAMMQVCGVAAFMLGAAGSGRLAHRFSSHQLTRAGAWLQIIAGILLVLLAVVALRSLPLLIACWVVFCAGLGVRAPALMVQALSVTHELAGKASGLLMFMAFSLSSLATMSIAPLLAYGLLPVALGLTLLSIISTWIAPVHEDAIGGRDQKK